jgi:hypothetical protein
VIEYSIVEGARTAVMACGTARACRAACTVVAEDVRRLRRAMADDPRKQYMRRLVDFLREKMRSPGFASEASGEIIVRRHEVEEIALSAGFDEEEAWRIFTRLKGHAWQGHFMDESRSEQREYTAARLTWVDHVPR